MKASSVRYELHPPHHSARGKRLRPRGMDRMQMEPEHLEAVERICLGILTDMTNGERSLTEILVACYLSGAQNAVAIIAGEPRS